MTLRHGELFAGYGGLGMGIDTVLDTELAWYSEIDKGALKVLRHRHPDVPNVGDITTVDWSTVEPVDVLSGGSPCQDLSHAGKRAGMTEGTRSNLWVAMREAVAALQPALVIWENVRGAYSAEADSALESDPRLLDSTRRRDGEPVLRALGRVLGDLADLGYDTIWHGLRAADVGAPHGRFRCFLIAYPVSGGRHDALRGQVRGTTTPCGSESISAGLLPTPTSSDTNGAGAHGDGGLDLRTAVALLPTPTRQDGSNNGGASQHRRNTPPLNTVATLLPTPAVNDMGEGKTPDAWDTWTATMQTKHGNGNGHGKSLAIEAQRLLPTPEAARAGGTPERHLERKLEADGSTRTVVTNLDVLAAGNNTPWGDYAAAIVRWETIHGTAPEPTTTSSKGNPQLSAHFTEWMMGVPAGWITDVPGVTRNEALKLCGNGVVPQQAAHALRAMLNHLTNEAAA